MLAVAPTASFEESRARKMAADAEIAELDLALRRKEVAKTADVVKAWETVLHAARTKFLAVPTKLAPVLAPMTDPASIKDYLEQAVREALEEMANYQPQVDPTVTASLVKAEEAEKPKRPRGRPKRIDKL